MKAHKNLLLLAGVLGSLLGTMLLAPAFLERNYLLASISGVLVIGGLVFVAFGFGD